MRDEPRFVRRNRVDERIALAIAVVAGAVATAAGASPTGSAGIDLVLVFVATGAVVWAAASAPWWAPALASGIGAAIALNPLVALVGLAGFVGGLVVGIRRRDQSELRALVAAVAVNVLIRSDLGAVHGLSAMIGIATCGTLAVLGLLRRPLAIRRRGWIALGLVGGAAVVALLATAVVGAAARPDLSAGAREARQAISSLNTGDYQQAAQLFEQASRSFGRADHRLVGALAAPSRLVPGVAQNVDAGAELSRAAAVGTADAAAALRSIDPESMRVVDGQIDLDAVEAVAAPLEQVRRALVELRAIAEEVASPWLIGPVQDELTELHERLDANEPRLDNAIDAVALAPQMLGADGERRYLVLFTSPVETRGLTGFMGNYAIVTIDEGRVEVDEFGRRTELEQFVSEHGASCADCPPEVVERYGRFGLADGQLKFHPRGWSSITLPAHFPHVGETAQLALPQSGGGEIDGVIAMDPHVVQALMNYTGPIELPDAGVTVRPENALRFLLADQYLLIEGDDNEDRLEAIDTLGQQVIEALLAGALPEPSHLARDLGPLVYEHRLLVWTDEPKEQDLLERVGLLGALPPMGDDGGFSFMVSNAGHSKIDYFLERTVDVEIRTDADGDRTLVAEVTLTNTAPTTGLPPYVIGNDYGLPLGSARLWVNLFGPPGAPTVLRDGEPIDVTAPTLETGWWAVDFYDVIESGDSVTYRVEYELGPAADAVDEPVMWTQPLARRSP